MIITTTPTALYSTPLSRQNIVIIAITTTFTDRLMQETRL